MLQKLKGKLFSSVPDMWIEDALFFFFSNCQALFKSGSFTVVDSLDILIRLFSSLIAP